jgi:hypothetical protein
MLNANLADRMKLTVNLTVNAIIADKIALRDNGLQTPLMIEWE